MLNHSVPKILLLVNSPPYGGGIGEIFLREIAEFYPANKLVRYSTVSDNRTSENIDWLGFPSYVRPVPFSRFPIKSTVSDWQLRTFHLNALTRDVKDLIRSQNIDVVWSVLSSSSIIYITERLMQECTVPVLATVLDTPEYFSTNQHLDQFTKTKMLRSYANILRGAMRVSVICESMREVFARRYNIASLILRHGEHPDTWQKRQASAVSSDQFTIGFAGSLYAKTEWNALLRALTKAGAYIAGRPVKVQYIGRFPRTSANTAPFVEFSGMKSATATLEILSGVDVAYLPYWFSQKYSYVVNTSFPGKLSTYLAAGAPVFYHGPERSSPVSFFRSYPAGLCCHSLTSTDIVQILSRLATDIELLAEMAHARQAALEQELGLEVMLQQFATLLGIARSDLKPLIGLNSSSPAGGIQ